MHQSRPLGAARHADRLRRRRAGIGRQQALLERERTGRGKVVRTSLIAGMVGADGLGKEVTAAISTLDVAQGVEAGLAVVILAVYLDRLTAALGDLNAYKSSLLSQIRNRKG